MIFRTRAFIASLAGVLTSTAAHAGIGPENVAVVVNGDSQNSLRVANEYARLRGIPAGNFIVLHHISGTEQINVDQFRDEILKPTLSTLETRGLTAQIDCIAYSVDIPYTIDVSADIKGRPLPQVITQPASINGLTYLSDWVLKGDIDYLRLDINRYARKLLPLPEGTELTAAEQTAYAEAMSEYTKKNYKAAIAGLTKLLETPRTDPNVSYNLACCQALTGDADSAVLSLRMAMRAGWRNYGQTASDPDLKSLADMDDYKQILKLLRSSPIEMQPGVGFRHSAVWDRTGAAGQAGPHYMLSTVLGVTTGRGDTVDEVIASLRRSQGADFSAPKGTVYFERNGDVRSMTREWGFQPAADELKKLGIDAIVEDGTLPQNRTDVIGAVIGISDFDWPASHSAIVPGAILEHLTSFGGMIEKGAGQTPCTEFIRNGASGSSGTVTEPYALQEKFPTPFIQVQYAKGFTLAESFYLSLSGPYQLLVIGDPLCRPWAKKVTLKVDGMPAADDPIGAPVVLHASALGATPISKYQLFVDGKWVQDAKPGATLTLDPKALSEGYHQVSVVAEKADSTAAQYREMFTVTVAGGHKVETTKQATATADGEIRIAASASGATNVEFYSLGALVGTMTGGKGTVSIKASSVGPGFSLIYPVAIYSVGGKTVRVNGAPIKVAVT